MSDGLRNKRVDLGWNGLDRLVTVSGDVPRPSMADALLRVSAHEPNDPLQSRILGNAASKILEDLFLKELNVRTGNRSYQATSLAVLSLCADLFDGYIAHELEKPVLSVCKKAWRKRQRNLLGSLPSSTTGAIRSTASKLKQEFRASLASSGAAGRLADELAAISLALVIQYPDRETDPDRYTEATDALRSFVTAMSNRAV